MMDPSLLDGRSGAATIAITDSGLGGLLICAELERRLRGTEGDGSVRLAYVDAWPETGRGYNDLPDLPCNTLSVVYEATAFGRTPAVPVTGILDEGTALFHEALDLDPASVLALFGTRTTIGSGEYVRRLNRSGIGPERVFPESCHGLAAVIDKDPGSPAVPGLVEECVLRVVPRLPSGAPVHAGLACTHYAYVAEAFRTSLGRRAGAKVEILDPGGRFVDGLTRGLSPRRPGATERDLAVEVISKVELPEAQRRAVARRLEPLSPATARALVGYTHVPELF